MDKDPFDRRIVEDLLKVACSGKVEFIKSLQVKTTFSQPNKLSPVSSLLSAVQA